MEEPVKRYSKISSALKHYFLVCLYYHCLDFKEASDRCRINYSTANIILKELTPQEKHFIKRTIRRKEKDQSKGLNVQETCTYFPAQKVNENGDLDCFTCGV